MVQKPQGIGGTYENPQEEEEKEMTRRRKKTKKRRAKRTTLRVGRAPKGWKIVSKYKDEITWHNKSETAAVYVYKHLGKWRAEYHIFGGKSEGKSFSSKNRALEQAKDYMILLNLKGV